MGRFLGERIWKVCGVGTAVFFEAGVIGMGKMHT